MVGSQGLTSAAPSIDHCLCRVPENTSLGTDHGTATLMFVAGHQVRSGRYGALPSLRALDDNDHLLYTTDCCRVSASVMAGWLGYANTRQLLYDECAPFPRFDRVVSAHRLGGGVIGRLRQRGRCLWNSTSSSISRVSSVRHAAQ